MLCAFLVFHAYGIPTCGCPPPSLLSLVPSSCSIRFADVPSVGAVLHVRRIQCVDVRQKPEPGLEPMIGGGAQSAICALRSCRTSVAKHWHVYGESIPEGRHRFLSGEEMSRRGEHGV